MILFEDCLFLDGNITTLISSNPSLTSIYNTSHGKKKVGILFDNNSNFYVTTGLKTRHNHYCHMSYVFNFLSLRVLHFIRHFTIS